MKRSDFTVLLKDIPIEGLEREYALEPGDVESLALAVKLEGSMRARVRIAKHGDRVLLRGWTEAKVGLECSRCLEHFPLQLRGEIDAAYQTGREECEGGERELSAAELELEPLRGGRLDLLGPLVEQIHLAIPVKPLCGVECRGWCSGCGRNLNRESCSCPPRQDDGPWAALKKLKVEE